MDTKVTIEYKSSSVVLNGITDKPIKVPSQMYPLTGELRYISHANTAPFPESPLTDKIRQIYDALKPEVGACYSNTDKLLSALEAEGIKAQSYVGWVFLDGGLPVHHCFAAIGNCILDYATKVDYLYQEEHMNATPEQIRDKMTDTILELSKKPNSESTTFGQVSEHMVCFVSQCKPQDGVRVFKKLMRAFPNHPCYRNVVDGANKTQRMLYHKQHLNNKV